MLNNVASSRWLGLFRPSHWYTLYMLVKARIDLRLNFALAITPIPLSTSPVAGSKGLTPNHRRAQELARVVFGIGRRLPGSRCLDQALALTRMLRQKGYPAVLAIGARHSDGSSSEPTSEGKVGASRFRAHAWVQCDELILDPDPDHTAHFSRLL